MLGLAAAHWGRTRAAMVAAVAPSQDSVARASVGCGPSMKKLLNWQLREGSKFIFFNHFPKRGRAVPSGVMVPLGKNN